MVLEHVYYDMMLLMMMMMMLMLDKYKYETMQFSLMVLKYVNRDLKPDMIQLIMVSFLMPHSLKYYKICQANIYGDVFGHVRVIQAIRLPF